MSEPRESAPSRGEGAGPADEPRAALVRALESNRWNRGDAARALGVSRSTLWRRMKAAGLE